MSKLAVAFAIVGLTFTARSASAAERVVAPGGSVQQAIDQAAAGDTIVVENGTYAGFTIKNRASLTIRARNLRGARITSASANGQDGIDILSSSNIVIDGLDVSGAPRAGISIRSLGDLTGGDTAGDVVRRCHVHDNGAGVTAGRHDGIFTGFAKAVLIEDNEVWGNSEHGIYVSNAGDDPIIRRNVSHHNLANGIQINADAEVGGDGVITNWLIEANVVHHNGGGAGINLDGACHGVARNNLLYANARAGITLFREDAAEGAHDNVIVNNTVYNEAGSRAALQIAPGATNNTVLNNVLYAVGSGIEAHESFTHDYNVVSSLTGGTLAAHEQILPVAQALSATYHPLAALRDHGTTQRAPQNDLAGNARPQGGAIDIGCYEETVAPAPPPPPQDAGTPPPATQDAGAPPPPNDTQDAGAPPPPATTADAGTPPNDTTPPPAADPPAHAGSAATPEDASEAGASCHAAPGRARTAWSAALVALVALATRRRRRT